ncbi:MAG: hypothetical protein IT566_11815 [Rhodospirillaceae bacterium]|nr:hypothetical protein [Rhodospirillaceae bacterium]
MIESARQKNVMALYDQLRAAQNTFLDRYKALPGDYNEASTKIHTSVTDGNRNGYVSDGTGAAGTDVTSIAAANGATGEAYMYFQSLIASGLFAGGQMTTTFTTTFSGGAVASAVPAAPWTNTGFTVAHGTHTGDPGGAGATNIATTIWLRLSTGVSTLTATSAPLTAASAFQIDQKFDDGRPESGRIRNINQNTATCGGTNSGYVVTNANGGARQCDLIFSTD